MSPDALSSGTVRVYGPVNVGAIALLIFRTTLIARSVNEGVNTMTLKMGTNRKDSDNGVPKTPG